MLIINDGKSICTDSDILLGEKKGANEAPSVQVWKSRECNEYWEIKRSDFGLLPYYVFCCITPEMAQCWCATNNFTFL